MTWWKAYCSIFPVHTLFSCGDHLTAVAALLILSTTRQGFQGWPGPVCCHTYAFLSSPQVTIRPDLGAQSMDVTRMSCSFKMSLALARGLLLPRPKNQNMKVELLHVFLQVTHRSKLLPLKNFVSSRLIVSGKILFLSILLQILSRFESFKLH